jgi:hypothetical protein
VDARGRRRRDLARDDGRQRLREGRLLAQRRLREHAAGGSGIGHRPRRRSGQGLRRGCAQHAQSGPPRRPGKVSPLDAALAGQGARRPQGKAPPGQGARRPQGKAQGARRKAQGGALWSKEPSEGEAPYGPLRPLTAPYGPLRPLTAPARPLPPRLAAAACRLSPPLYAASVVASVESVLPSGQQPATPRGGTDPAGTLGT